MLAFDLITLSVKGRVPKPNRLLPFLFTSHIQNITNVCLRMSSAINYLVVPKYREGLSAGKTLQ
jgi:hypothetical protein